MVNSVKDLYVDLNPFYLIGSTNFYQKYKDFVKYVEKAITQVSLANYLGMRFTFTFDDDFTENHPSLKEGETIFQLIQRCIEKINGRFKGRQQREYDYKFIDGSNKIYSINGISEDEKHRFIFQFTDPKQQIVDSSFLEMSDSQITRMVSLVYAKTENTARKHIEKQMRDYESDEGLYNPKLYDKKIFILLANCLLLMAECICSAKFDYQVHSPFEISYIRKLITNNDDQFPIIKAPMLTSKKSSPEDLIDKYSYSFSYDFNESLNSLFNKYKGIYDDIPEVDFSTQQVSQMQKYVDRKIKDKDASIDFIDVLNKQKFGKVFKINIDENNSKEGEMLFTIISTDRSDDFLIQILYTFDKKYDFLFNIYISAGKTFRKLEEQIHGIEVFIYIKDLNAMLSSIVDFTSILPKHFKEIKTLIALSKIFSAMFIMIADNPVKFGAAKEIRHSSTTVWKNRKPVEEKKEIIKHIIGFRSTLREKVKEQNSDSSIKREVEYVLEKWERAGHYRNYKSGKQVWISKTDCHRHLDLTNKKVKITL